MALASPTKTHIGWKAHDFALAGVDGRTYSLADVRGPKGTLFAFICNHCPYVKAIIGRFVEESGALRQIGIGTIAIMPNDTAAYPEDSFEHMKEFSRRHGFPFPYVIDQTQAVARAYDAQCTPDFFGFNVEDELQYRGRLDSSRTTLVKGARRDLYEAMKEIAEKGRGPAEQFASIGCSIKWR
jgi:peroxiredoxin